MIVIAIFGSTEKLLELVAKDIINNCIIGVNVVNITKNQSIVKCSSNFSIEFLYISLLFKSAYL